MKSGNTGKRTAIIPGSFDPMTLGHLDVVKRASGLFDRIVVAIMVNEEKADTGMFSFAERKRIAELTVGDLPDVTVITAGGYLADLAGAMDACAIVKGVRNTEDFEYEQKMAFFNHDRNPRTETVYLPSYGDVTNISSTKVRKMIESGEDTEGLLAPAAAEYIRSIPIKGDK